MISGTSCRHRWPTWSACSAVSKYQPTGHTAHETVYCWQPCLSGCCSSSLELSARGRHLIVITAVFPATTKDSSFQLLNPHLIFLNDIPLNFINKRRRTLANDTASLLLRPKTNRCTTATVDRWKAARWRQWWKRHGADRYFNWKTMTYIFNRYPTSWHTPPQC